VAPVFLVAIRDSWCGLEGDCWFSVCVLFVHCLSVRGCDVELCFLWLWYFVRCFVCEIGVYLDRIAIKCYYRSFGEVVDLIEV